MSRRTRQERARRRAMTAEQESKVTKPVAPATPTTTGTAVLARPHATPQPVAVREPSQMTTTPEFVAALGKL